MIKHRCIPCENYFANIDLLVLFEKILQSLNEWQLAFELKYCTEKISGHHHDSVLLIIRYLWYLPASLIGSFMYV